MLPREEEKKHFLKEAQARECTLVLAHALKAVLQDHQALDHFLNGVFRSNPKYGSKDRRRIGDAVFRVFRDYVFLEKLLEKKAQSPENLLLFSSVLAGEKEYPELWLASSFVPEELLSEAAGGKDISERICLLGKNLSLKDNLPSFLTGYFPTPEAHEDVAASLLTRSPLWFRLNFPSDRKITKFIIDEFASFDLSLAFHKVKKDAFRIEGDKKVLLQNFSSFRKGCFEIQDLSSQCIGYACTFLKKEDERDSSILDCCAGGGGKSLQMASFLHEKGSGGKVFAWDIRRNKLEETFRRGRKAGLKNIFILDSFPEGKKFDKVLIDAPCSGSGRWRRAPEQRLLLTVDELEKVILTQREILENASECVKEGGILSYGTCSVFYKENMGNIGYFLEKHPEFSLEEFVSPLDGSICPGFLSVLPSSGNCDGAFVARMRKKL